jgi:alkanesulfonate monooxygenase SsuD/methylene tetrahydromethanopterin reductase-like flavin-dependent oxidoreductase (luciferase family)
MDALSFDTLWLAEHHFQHEGYECIPNDLMLAVHLAHMTKTLKIDCAFNIAPMWHPLRLAEDFATADILTGGRTIFGVGRGYHTREVETFGAPMLNQEANRELFEEQVEIIFKAFNEESFSHQGKHYTLPPRVPYRGYELLTAKPRPGRVRNSRSARICRSVCIFISPGPASRRSARSPRSTRSTSRCLLR